ncbi:AzlC family ABC transporter permease [Afifella sp. IM 167]|uniref:AzlC family ABC transporter permease n=1 Tax=Afifella sp. IM 167 TaxID=2033586 RepID=UPI001CC919DF|nr:AzlC family ABC transporter permease [Afifella sp. IM 167]MBZ8135203.1 branched-chain amino acid ABC transporter permease [Afifella sp. IM 167]
MVRRMLAPAEPSSRRTQILLGLRDMAPVLLPNCVFGMLFGAIATSDGMPFGRVVAMSAVFYAGASQFVALELWGTPLPFWTIVLAVLAVNFRHILYSAALGRRTRHWPLSGRLLAFAGLTDPVFALSEYRAGPRLSAAYYVAVSGPLYLAWVGATGVGAAFGSGIGDPGRFSLDFVMTAYFIFLVTRFRSRPNAFWVIAASALAALPTWYFAGAPWHIGAGAFAGISVAVLLAGGTGARSDEDEAAA